MYLWLNLLVAPPLRGAFRTADVTVSGSGDIGQPREAIPGDRPGPAGVPLDPI
jgi:hypothetical protein